ncbi:hypothetical protein [Acidimangrovimonas pyrenivorans]|uniref:Uncharacterized protein n=1 Tax=Acidimangrovimonas pyrenivorans TaxID=2030798 RepID=A0ABV7AIM3_9RHOB
MTVETQKDEFIYVLLHEKDNSVIQHTVTSKKPQKSDIEGFINHKSKKKSEEVKAAPPAKSETFVGTLKAFQSVMTTYRRAIAFTIKVSPSISALMVTKEISEFAGQRGQKMSDISTDECTIYKLPQDCAGTISERYDAAMAAIQARSIFRKSPSLGW